MHWLAPWGQRQPREWAITSHAPPCPGEFAWGDHGGFDRIVEDRPDASPLQQGQGDGTNAESLAGLQIAPGDFVQASLGDGCEIDQRGDFARIPIVDGLGQADQCPAWGQRQGCGSKAQQN